MKVFLDTNVVLDFLDANRPRYADSRLLMGYLIEHDHHICISEDMLTTIYYIAKDKRKTLHFFNMVLASWQVLPFGEETLLKALTICQESTTTIDFEDVLQCLCASAYGCDCLITNDTPFYACGIQVYDANTFVTRITPSTPETPFL